MFGLHAGLSYWLARRLPVSELAKLDLLSIDCPTFRLIKGMAMLKVCGPFTVCDKKLVRGFLFVILDQKSQIVETMLNIDCQGGGRGGGGGGIITVYS